MRLRACSAGVKSSLMKIDFPFRRVRPEVNSFRTFVDVNLTKKRSLKEKLKKLRQHFVDLLFFFHSVKAVSLQ